MALDVDDEILQDFLIEAGEILEQLGEQLVDLEQRPQDVELLNTVFRGFHTIKGGAGFLALESMVALCHRAEDVFNLLRNGERQVDTQLMDIMLPVLDMLNDQFESLRAGEEPAAAEPALLAALEALSLPAAPVAAPPPPAPPASPTSSVPSTPPGQCAGAAVASGSGEDITDEEFEALLDAMEGSGEQGDAVAAGVVTPATGAASSSDEISGEEFETLLDDLHGKGQFNGQPATLAAGVNAGKVGTEDITDDEFEALLDGLHGKGKFSGEVVAHPVAKPGAPVGASATAATGGRTAGARAEKHEGVQTETTVRVDTKRLDDIMNLVGELVLARNRLARLEENMADEAMAKAVSNLDLVTADLQTAVMKTRMQPIKKVFGRFPRVVRDLARHLEKEIKLELQGEETDLDKNLVEALADPLVHLVRNAVDHGIELPDVREAAGKPRSGTVILSAEQEGDHILLSIEDDGAGMDVNVLRNKAVEKGLLDADAAARLDRRDTYNLIFMPGFSTKTEISDVSGRGVGMDVVKTRIAQLNGTVDIDSQLGKGSRLSIKVPLTLAIMPTLMVKLDTQMFALPLVSVSEIFHLDLSKTNTVDGQLVVMVRAHALPLFYLSRWLIKGCENRSLPGFGHVVVVQAGTQRVGFVVDQLIGQEEVVIKPLGTLLHGIDGLAGATITGDGRIAIILDIPGIMDKYARRA